MLCMGSEPLPGGTRTMCLFQAPCHPVPETTQCTTTAGGTGTRFPYAFHYNAHSVVKGGTAHRDTPQPACYAAIRDKAAIAVKSA